MHDNWYSDSEGSFLISSPPTLSCLLLTLNNLTPWFKIRELNENWIHWMRAAPPKRTARNGPLKLIHIFN